MVRDKVLVLQVRCLGGLRRVRRVETIRLAHRGECCFQITGHAQRLHEEDMRSHERRLQLGRAARVRSCFDPPLELMKRKRQVDLNAPIRRIMRERQLEAIDGVCVLAQLK